MTKLANGSSKTCLTTYEVVQSDAGKLAKISQGMSAIKSTWYFQSAKILQYSCLLADQSRFTGTLFLAFFPPCSAAIMRWENEGDGAPVGFHETSAKRQTPTLLHFRLQQRRSLQIAENEAKPLNLMS